MVLFFYWGSNVFAQYGNNTTTQFNIPLLVSCPANLSKLDFSKYKCGVVPNPSKGIFTIQTENPINNANITVADLNGRIVNVSKPENLDNKSLDLNHLQNGIYILNIASADYNYSQKIVKQ